MACGSGNPSTCSSNNASNTIAPSPPIDANVTRRSDSAINNTDSNTTASAPTVSSTSAGSYPCCQAQSDSHSGRAITPSRCVANIEATLAPTTASSSPISALCRAAITRNSPATISAITKKRNTELSPSAAPGPIAIGTARASVTKSAAHQPSAPKATMPSTSAINRDFVRPSNSPPATPATAPSIAAVRPADVAIPHESARAAIAIATARIG